MLRTNYIQMELVKEKYRERDVWRCLCTIYIYGICISFLFFCFLFRMTVKWRPFTFRPPELWAIHYCWSPSGDVPANDDDVAAAAVATVAVDS